MTPLKRAHKWPPLRNSELRMDRFEWLRCQPWLLPWRACHLHLASQLPCAPCAARTPSLCPLLNWVFHGFASFHAFAKLPHFQPDQDDLDIMSPLSEDAAHLFFSVQPPLCDPSQLALKVGVAGTNSGRPTSVVVLAFDDSGLYLLDFHQVLAISTWKPEQGCKLCRNVSRDADKEDACACQLLPGYLTLRLKHVALNIYSMVQSKDCLGAVSQKPSQSIGVLDQLYTTLEEGRLHSIYGFREEDDAVYSSPATAELNSLVNNGNVMLQQFLTRLDCMSECAVRAVEVCSADVPWLCRLLRTMAQHAAGRKANSMLLKTLQNQLQSCLRALEEEEEAHITRIWGANPRQQQVVRTLGVAALQQTMEQRKQLEEAVLWLELMNAA